MLLKLISILAMLVGLGLTVVPRTAGTIVIIAGAVFYKLVSGVTNEPTWIWYSLVALIFLAEGGGRGVRYYFTNKLGMSRELAIASTAGNVGGVLISNALFGPILGFLLWEIIIGKALYPRWDVVYSILIRLALTALLRFSCGVVMIIIVLVWLM
ncbi:MAG: hypothetical protein H6Q67_203 [Firmicutes bacterium]|nr:hypothetical protein [Bacillota bacterium]